MSAKSNKEKSCLNCKAIYIGDKCPKCEETPSSDAFKGRVYIFDAKKSELAEKMNINSEGEFAIKSK